MPAYLKKNDGEILNEVLQKLVKNTPFTSVSPGSLIRAFAEAISTELGDIYDIMDYNLNQQLVSTATGSALDALGVLYNVTRKTINNMAAIDKQLGAFIFYLDTPVNFDVKIPNGTNVYTDAQSYIGRRFSYHTDAEVTIAAGRTRAYAGLIPNFSDTVFTAGAGSITLHDMPNSPNAIVRCTNPKEIGQQLTFETDDAYRLRIIKNVRVTTGGTLEAVRYAGLAVTGVRDLRVRQTPYGMGSFEVIVVPERNGSQDQILAAATAAVEAVRPLGTRVYIKSPTGKALDISVDLIMVGASSTALSAAAIKRVQVGVARYFNSFLPGNPLVYNRLISIILDASELVKDVIVRNLSVNGVEIMRRNYQPADDEQIVPGNITVGLAVS
jgi:uncharacterized phage protein gp47/JayE